MQTEQVVTSFMADCQLRGLSAKTLESYSRHLKRLTEISPGYPPQPETVQSFLANLSGSPYNRHSYYRTYRALANYGWRKFRVSNFMRSIKSPRIPRDIMPTLSSTELELLAILVRNAPIRDKAILTLFMDTAIRSGEASSLQRRDILEDRIIVRGKTGCRVAPISEMTRSLLLSLPVHEDGYVFHGYRKEPLAKTGFYKVIRTYLQAIGYQGKQFGPQLLRRSFGRFYLRDGGDMRSLSLILGHSNINTTANYYAPLLAQDIIEIHRKHTPGRVFQNI